MSVSDYETLLENLRKQRQLCKKIQELQLYRNKLGLTKLKEIEKYKEEEKQARLERDEMKTPRKRRKSSLKGDGLTSIKRITRRTQRELDQTPSLIEKKIDVEVHNEDSNISMAKSPSSTRSRASSINSENLEETIVKEMSELITEEDNAVMNEEGEEEERRLGSDGDMCEDEETASVRSTVEDYEEDLSSGMASSGGSGVNEIAHDPGEKKYRRRVQSKSNTPKPNLKRSPIKNNQINKANLIANGNLADDSRKKKGMSKSFTQRNGRSERLCSMPGYNLLSDNEKKLVMSLQLKPDEYINYKTNLIKVKIFSCLISFY